MTVYFVLFTAIATAVGWFLAIVYERRLDVLYGLLCCRQKSLFSVGGGEISQGPPLRRPPRPLLASKCSGAR
jgi:hypothetical protein